MKKLIILGSGWFQREFVKKAKSLGYEVHLFGTGSHWTQTSAVEFADYHYPISVLDHIKILEMARDIKPAGICSIGADVVVPTMNFLNKELGLVGNSIECSKVSTNKYEMKKRFVECGVPTANFIFVGESFNPDDLPFNLPVIVKAVDKSGKYGITKVEKIEGLKPAINLALEESLSSNKVLIEEYIEGKEYSLEGMSWWGDHRILAFTEKFNIPPHFVEEMHLQPAPFDTKMRGKLLSIFVKTMKALDIQNGASHAEFKITPAGEVRVIEVASRMAAESMWEVIQISTGLDYMKMVIDSAVGRLLDWKKAAPSPVGLVKFLVTEKDFETLEKIKKNRPDTIHRIDDILMPFDKEKKITHNGDRYGLYLLKCASREEALELTQPQYDGIQ